MEIVQNFEIRNLADLSPGDLFVIQFGDVDAIGIALEQPKSLEHSGECLFAVLQDSSEPHYNRLSGETSVASYGSAWRLQYTDRRAPAPGRETGSGARAGTIAVSTGSAIMRLKPSRRDPSQFDSFIDLKAYRMVQQRASPNDISYVTRWKIWLRDDDPNRPGAEPFYSFKPPTS